MTDPELSQQPLIAQESFCSAEDALKTIEMINLCIQAEQGADLERVFGLLKELLGFESLYFHLVDLNESGDLLEHADYQVNWPVTTKHPEQSAGLEHHDPVFSLLLSQQFSHHYWNMTLFQYEGNPQWQQIAIQSGLNEGYAVRSYTSNKREFSQINIAGGVDFTRRTEFILDTIKPHIHQAYTHIQKQRDQSLLEDREKNILQMLQKGMNRRMIAEELAISESRTQQLMNKIYTKLDAHNAPHAVAVSLSRGLIDFA